MTDPDYYKLNFGQMFFIMTSLIPMALCLPCWLVAKYVYKPFVKQQEDEEDDEDEEIPFQHQFPLSLALNTREMDESFEQDLILTSTPDGDVYMRYSKEDEGFEYWTDKTIAYRYLESVARNYVTTFKCKNLYVDRMALLQEKLKKIREDIKRNKEAMESDMNADSEDEKEEDVFVNLKSYNKTTNDNTQKTKITRSDIVCDKANKYIKKGNLKDAEFIKSNRNNVSSNNGMSFNNWKIWQSKNKNE